jgi:hypothetical protein
VSIKICRVKNVSIKNEANIPIHQTNEEISINNGFLSSLKNDLPHIPIIDTHVMTSAIARFRMVTHAPLRSVFKGSIIIARITTAFKITPVTAKGIVMILRIFRCLILKILYKNKIKQCVIIDSITIYK